MRPSALAIAFLLLAALPGWADSVTLENGNVITGEIVERSADGAIVLQHPQLGRLSIAADQYREVSLGPESGPGAEAVAESAVPEQKEPAARGGLFGTRLLRGWKNSFGAGLSGSAGGFEDTKLNVLFETGIEDRKRRWDFDSAYFLNVTPKRDNTDQKTSKNQGFGQLSRRWFFPDSERWSRWFLVARTRYDYNEFQPWKHRVAASAGPGYKLLQSEKWQLSVNTGFGLSQTFGTSDLLSPEGTFGFDLEWKPNAWNEVKTRNQFFLSVTDASRYRTVQSLQWNIDLGDPGGVGFRLGVNYQFDTESSGKENDLTYVSSLTYDF